MGLLGVKEGDVPSELRAHAALVADGHRPRAQRALLVEIGPDGVPTLYQFGQHLSYREALSCLLAVAHSLNAEASN